MAFHEIEEHVDDFTNVVVKAPDKQFRVIVTLVYYFDVCGEYVIETATYWSRLVVFERKYQNILHMF